ncbi:MAG: tripartite tricarboxylate transporter substrate binding protein [Betaproteobacteria bacterium]|nr:tripartite tricarboxylate transporter substrate binding protein [Betaproteobacteria bacterium]
MRSVFLAIAMVAAFVVAQSGHAQPYPAKPIRLVLPYPPGGLSDVIARALVQKMGDTLGQPLVLENIPGAGSTVGTSAVARAAPNGYTLLFAYSSGLTIGPGLYAKPGYDPLVSFVPIGTVARFFYVLAAHSSLPAGNVRELIAYAKANPGKIALGTPGIGATPHLLGEIFKESAGVDIVHVPYKGGGPLTIDLLAGRVSLSWDGVANVRSGIQSGKLKPLAVTTPSRLPEFPEIQTITEAGMPELAIYTWTALLAPAGTPREITSRLEDALNKALATPDLREAYAGRGLEVFPNTPEQVSELMRAELPRWAAVIKRANVKVE